MGVLIGARGVVITTRGSHCLSRGGGGGGGGEGEVSRLRGGSHRHAGGRGCHRHMGVIAVTRVHSRPHLGSHCHTGVATITLGVVTVIRG